MEKVLYQLRNGDITFDSFYRTTISDWDAMAQDLHNKIGWRLQGNADVDDIRQEMLMSASRSIETWDSELGYGLKKFVVWNAHTDAKAFVSRQCGAYKHRSTEDPREPISMAHMPLAHESTSSAASFPPATRVAEYLDSLSAVDPDQEWFTLTRTHRDALCKTMVENVVMDRLLTVGASLAAIADSIYNDSELRASLELSTRSRAYGLVRRITTEFANRAAEAA